MTSQAAYTSVACPLCWARLPAAELAEHLEECRRREHDARERFE